MLGVSNDVEGEEFCSRLDVELCDCREESMEVLKNIHMFGKLQSLMLVDCELRDEDIRSMPMPSKTVKYLCLQGNALQNPWEAIMAKFPSVIHLDVRRNRIVCPVSVLGNRATNFCRVDVDLDDERWMKSLKDYCPGLTHVGAIRVSPVDAATTLEDEDVSDSEVNGVVKPGTERRKERREAAAAVPDESAPTTMARPTAADKGRVEAVLGKEQVSLKDLGEVIASTENGMDYERIVTEKMEGMHLDVHGLKDKMQRSMACVGRSTDNVVCDLAPIVEFQGNVLIGIASSLDAVLTSLPIVKRQLNGLNLSVFADSLAEMPAKTKISTANMRTEWKVERQGPFVETDLKEMLKLWEGRDVSGCGGGLKGIASAFYRQYFRSACRPVAMIQSYSCRQGRNRGKDKNLKDLPEGILHNLIGVVLDSVGLERAELDKTAEELKGAPTDFWRSLAENDSDREEQLRKLQDCRAGWKAQLRRYVGSALAEVRLSPCENGVLTPRKRRAHSSLSVSATPK